MSAFKGLGRSRVERNQRKAHRMWTRGYMQWGWRAFIWPAMSMHDAQERAEQ